MTFVAIQRGNEDRAMAVLEFLLEFVYEPSSQKKLEVRQRAASHFLLRALNTAPASLFVDFFGGCIAKVLCNLTKNVAGSEAARKEALVVKAISCQLIGNYYFQTD